MGRNLLRRSPAYLPPFDSLPKPQGKHSKTKKTKKNKLAKNHPIKHKKKEKKGTHTPFLVNDMKIVQSHSYKKPKKSTETQNQLMDYLFSQVEEQKNISAEIYDKITQYDSLLNQILKQKNNLEENIPIPIIEVEKEKSVVNTEEVKKDRTLKMNIPAKNNHLNPVKTSFDNIIELLNSLNPCTKVDSIVINDTLIDVDTFISYNPLNRLVYFLRDRNIVVVNATQIHEIGFTNIPSNF